MSTDLKLPVSVIVNVYNEAETIESELRNIHAVIVSKLPGSELIVAEDGSSDGTKEIIGKLVNELGVIHSTSEERKGYTKALRDALMIAKCPYIFYSDTGNKHNPNDFWKLYEYCDKFDLVLGIKTNRTDQLYRRLLTTLYNKVLSSYFNVSVNDADSGFRIYSQKAIKLILMDEWIFKELISSELTLRCLYFASEIKEVPVSYIQRKGSSRGLPPKKILRVIIGILKKFPSLKRALLQNRRAEL